MFNLISLNNSISNVKGFYCDGVNTGMKSSNIPDVGFIRSDLPCEISTVFTKNRFCAAPIKHFKNYEKNFKTNFILINSKNANAMTGEKGIEDINKIFSILKTKQKNIINPVMSSTGVIGYRLDREKIISAFDKFDFNAKNDNAIANAIMTTDKFKKEICFRVEIEGKEPFHIGAICKGAGMINPAMATMLCYILTDANIPKEDMDELLQDAVEQSFNTISVDGDTSTNDTVMLLSSALVDSYNKNIFKEALFRITKFLALEILRDGEGTNTIVAFEVKNAKNFQDAKKAANALSNSLLVKTAIHGKDPNWGRIASTIGASNIECCEKKLKIYYGNILLYDNNTNLLDTETEKKVVKIMEKNSFKIICDLGIGNACYTAYGCDLGHEYININANYRS